MNLYLEYDEENEEDYSNNRITNSSIPPPLILCFDDM